MDFDELSPDQMDKVKACKTTNELLELAKSEGYEISDAELDAIAGGSWCSVYCDDKEKCVRWFPK